MNEWTDRQTDGQMDKQLNGYADKWIAMISGLHLPPNTSVYKTDATSHHENEVTLGQPADG